MFNVQLNCPEEQDPNLYFDLGEFDHFHDMKIKMIEATRHIPRGETCPTLSEFSYALGSGQAAFQLGMRDLKDGQRTNELTISFVGVSGWELKLSELPEHQDRYKSEAEANRIYLPY